MKTKELKILAIGNSFSVDAMQWLYGIAKDGGIENIRLGNLYIGGCSLETHCNNFERDEKAYIYYKNTDDLWQEYPDTSIKHALLDENWDVITLQQVSGLSGEPQSYEPYLTRLIDFVNTNKTNSQAKLVWHMTWAYAGNSQHEDFARYDSSQTKMYKSIVSAVNSLIDTRKEISCIIPSGTAIQNARTSIIGDNLNRDGFHLDLYIGRYIAALTWFAKLTGLSVDNVSYIPENAFSKEYLEIAKKSVRNAVEKPYEVTQV